MVGYFKLGRTLSEEESPKRKDDVKAHRLCASDFNALLNKVASSGDANGEFVGAIRQPVQFVQASLAAVGLKLRTRVHIRLRWERW